MRLDVIVVLALHWFTLDTTLNVLLRLLLLSHIQY